MRAIAVLLPLFVWVEAVRKPNGSRYGFYRSMGQKGLWGPDSDVYTRRVFGGSAVELGSFPAACVLLDRYWMTRCSAAVVTPLWALTAAHCVSPHVAYIKYNARRPSSPEGDVVAVHYLYRHPSYKVVHEDQGFGMDVTLLHHDVGLVRTRGNMQLAVPLATNPLVAMRLYNPVNLKNEMVEVLGYGRTERSALGEELFQVQLQLVFCERGAWFHCVCGVAGGGDSRGVCSGDSGGPVVYRGVQVAVTSMGPIECSQAGDAEATSVAGEGEGERAASAPSASATSVFTALYNYADLLNATIHDMDKQLRMGRISAAPQARLAPAALSAAPLFVLILKL